MSEQKFNFAVTPLEPCSAQVLNFLNKFRKFHY